MATSGNDIVQAAFYDLGQISANQGITGTDMESVGQKELNYLISSLSTEEAMGFQQVRQTFNLQVGVSAYTLGATGSFPTTGALRAMKVTEWAAVYGYMRKGGPALKMSEFQTAASAKNEALADLYRQAMTEGVILAFPIQPAAPAPSVIGTDTAFPNLNVRVFPPPGPTVAGSIELAYWTPMSQITDFTAALALPDGWYDMLHFNLAVRLSPLYRRDGGISPELAANAQNTKQVIMQQYTMASQVAAPGGQQ